MSIRGWIIFKYKGLYYIFYNHNNSNPEYLGNNLIENLKNFNYKQLEELMINCVKNMNNKYENNIINIGIFNTIEELLKNPLNYIFYVKRLNGAFEKNTFIEFKYFINLDEELFTMINMTSNLQLHFPLFYIPKDWYNIYSSVDEAYNING